MTTGGDATPSDPVETAVTSPHAGVVTVMEFSAPTVDAFGFELLDFEVRVDAPAASPGGPAPGSTSGSIPASSPPDRTRRPWRCSLDGALAHDCSASSGAGPDPCVLRTFDPATGDIMLHVHASQAGVYTVGVFAGVGGDVALVSVNGDGTGAADAASFSSGPSFLAGRTISADGAVGLHQRRVRPRSPTTAGTDTDIFVRDLRTSATILVSVNADGTDGANDFSSEPVISADGTKVAFQSYADNLVAAAPTASRHLRA